MLTSKLERSLIFNFVTRFDDDSPARLYNFKTDIHLRGSYHFRERERDYLLSTTLCGWYVDPRTIHLKRTTIVPKNIQLVRGIRGEEGLIWFLCNKRLWSWWPPPLPPPLTERTHVLTVLSLYYPPLWREHDKTNYNF